MGLLSFLSRHSTPPAMTAEEAKALRARADAAAALASDLGRDLERMIARVDFLSRQVRELAEISKGRGKDPDCSPDLEAFFVSDRAGPRA